MQAPVGVGSGTIALASAHTSCLRQIVKERRLTDAAGEPGILTPDPRAIQALREDLRYRKGRARIIDRDRSDTSPHRKFSRALFRGHEVSGFLTAANGESYSTERPGGSR